MQLVVATASGAPTRSAKAASKAATRGPCETQPEATASATAAPSASVERRAGERDLHQDAFASGDVGELALGAPPVDQPREALEQPDLGLEAQALARGVRVGQAAR